MGGPVLTIANQTHNQQNNLLVTCGEILIAYFHLKFVILPRKITNVPQLNPSAHRKQFQQNHSTKLKTFATSKC